MKVLVTGASGFVGSHITDAILKAGIAVRVLLRPSSSRIWLPPHPLLEVSYGSLEQAQTIAQALSDEITHVVHCAGMIKAVRPSQFFETNQIGTRYLVQALSQLDNPPALMFLSTLSAVGPSSAGHHLSEESAPRPLSAYGKSKLAAEAECKKYVGQFLIIRAPAVYGPRDRSFLPLFKLVKRGIAPKRTRPFHITWIHVNDLARIIVHLLNVSWPEGKILHIGHPRPIDAGLLPVTLAELMGIKPIKIPITDLLFLLVGQLETIAALVTGKPLLLAHGKSKELTSYGWVTSTQLQQALLPNSFRFTEHDEGLMETWRWYERKKWL